ncbi:hypothetical protein LWM68_41025 [Niabella sp. W65]|nr:hypothetical protein [Niabella sp. W65]MCH7368557.1 hypothetical protein [Niabella sp. W65]ULT44147.1 hypothetical protein KRR40_12725 [Niabella sp. I65]
MKATGAAIGRNVYLNIYTGYGPDLMGSFKVLAAGWQRLVLHTTFPVQGTTFYGYVFGDFEAGDIVYCDAVYVGEGNKEIPYDISPKDIVAAIATAKQESINAANAYASAQAQAAETTAKAYADGKVTEAEQRSVIDATNKANAAKAYADAQDLNYKALLEAYTDGKIDDVEQQIINASAGNIQAAKTYTDAQAAAAQTAAIAYADGIVDAEETARIQQADDYLAASKAYAEAKDAALKVLTEAYTDGKITASEQAMIAVAEAKANLAEATAKAYADGIVDAEEAARIADATAKLNAAKLYAEQQDAIIKSQAALQSVVPTISNWVIPAPQTIETITDGKKEIKPYAWLMLMAHIAMPIFLYRMMQPKIQSPILSKTCGCCNRNFLLRIKAI